MSAKPKSWSELSPAQRRLVVIAGVTSALVQAWMLWDLRRRPAEDIRGSKRAWALASFVRPFGQLAYVFWGRRPEPAGDLPTTGVSPADTAAEPAELHHRP